MLLKQKVSAEGTPTKCFAAITSRLRSIDTFSGVQPAEHCQRRSQIKGHPARNEIADVVIMYCMWLGTRMDFTNAVGRQALYSKQYLLEFMPKNLCTIVAPAGSPP